MPEVRLEMIGMRYPNGVVAVHDLSLAVQPNEFFVLLGPSGCGKTTTLRLIAGLETPTAGRVCVGGQDLARRPPWQRGVALLFQTPALYPQRSVRENLAFGQERHYNTRDRMRHRLAPAELKQRLDDAVRLLSLEQLLERKPGELSGGERQRVALGRALIRRPAVFLLDEPLAHVDAPQRRQLGQQLKALQRRLEATVLHVTHDQAEALALADRIGVMRAGELQQIGTPEEVYDQPANRFVASFVGSPPMNLISGRLLLLDGQPILEGEGFRIPLDAPELPATAGNAVELGIRPEHLCLERANDSGVGWPMAVESVELFGGQSLVRLRSKELRMFALIDRSAAVSVGEQVMVRMEPTKACWFDGHSGRRLAVPGTAG